MSLEREFELQDIDNKIIEVETILEVVQIELDMYLAELKRLKEKKKFLEMGLCYDKQT